MSFIKKYLLPKEIDFNAYLLDQARLGHVVVTDLYRAGTEDLPISQESIRLITQRARKLKTRNMEELLDVFITPYDKESIYRMITQLDWLVLSVKHFLLEARVYNIHCLGDYEPILKTLVVMSSALEKGIAALEGRKLSAITKPISHIHLAYDQVVESCAEATARLLSEEDCKHIIRHKDILAQLKEIGKRIQVTANTLEDMAIKVI
ncbi:DUF47 domain-containing protein [Thiolapillus sp.]